MSVIGCFTACLAIRRARFLSRFVCMDSLLINYYYVNYTIFILYAYVAYTLKIPSLLVCINMPLCDSRDVSQGAQLSIYVYCSMNYLGASSGTYILLLLLYYCEWIASVIRLLSTTSITLIIGNFTSVCFLLIRVKERFVWNYLYYYLTHSFRLRVRLGHYI